MHCIFHVLHHLHNAGYANEFGESIRHIVPVRYVHFTYMVSSGYVLSHALSEGIRTHRTQMVNGLQQNLSKEYPGMIAFLDTLLWQGLASVLIPGVAINRLCAGVRILLTNKRIRILLAPVTRKWLVTGIGLSAIPLIVHPIDRYKLCVILYHATSYMQKNFYIVIRSFANMQNAGY